MPYWNPFIISILEIRPSQDLLWWSGLLVVVADVSLLLSLAIQTISNRIPRPSDEPNNPLLNDNPRPVVQTNIYYKLGVALASLLALTYVVAYVVHLLTTTTTTTTWRLQYDSPFLIFNFVFNIFLAVFIVRDKDKRLQSDFLISNFFYTVLFAVISLERVSSGAVLLPNDVLLLVTLLISVVLVVVVALDGMMGVKGADQVGEQDGSNFDVEQPEPAPRNWHSNGASSLD